MIEFNRRMKILTVIAMLTAMAGAVMAQITVVNTGSVVSPVADDTKTAVLSFKPGPPRTNSLSR